MGEVFLAHDRATQQAVAIYQEVVRREGLGPKGLAARDRIAAIELAAGHNAAATKLVAEVLDESARDDDALGPGHRAETHRAL